MREDYSFFKCNDTHAWINIPIGICNPTRGTNWFHIQCVISKYFIHEAALQTLNPRDVDLVVVKAEDRSNEWKVDHYRLIWKQN